MEYGEISEVAIEWGKMRRAAIDAKRARNEQRCENVDYEDETVSRYDYECWRADPAEWCASCRERQRLHDRYREAAKRRGVMNRKLARLVEPSRHGELE